MDINQIKKQGIAQSLVGEINRCRNQIREAADNLAPHWTVWQISQHLEQIEQIRKRCDEVEILLTEIQNTNKPS